MRDKRLVVVAFLLCLSAGMAWFYYSKFHHFSSFLSGESICLIDSFRLDFVTKGPPGITLKTINGESLSNWEWAGFSGSGTIWKSYAKNVIAGEAKLQKANTSLQKSANVFLSETPVNRWSWMGNQIWVKTKDRIQPTNASYAVEYVASKAPEPETIIKQDLVKPFNYGYIHNDSGETFRLKLFGLYSQLSSGDSNSPASSVIVKRAQQAVPYVPQSLIPAGMNSRYIYFSGKRPEVPPLELSSHNAEFREKIRFKRGAYALALFAKSSGTTDGIPKLRIKINRNKNRLIHVHKDDYQLYLLPFESDRNSLQVDVSFVNDSKFSSNSNQNAVSIRSIEVWSMTTKTETLQNGWTLLQRNELDLHRLDLSGMFQLQSSEQKFSKELYLPPGVATLEIQATAQFSGHTAPKLGVYIDEILVADIHPKKDLETYKIPFVVQAGLHKIKIAVLKDLSTDEKRIVNLSVVKMRYVDSAMIIERLEREKPQMAQDYLIQYPASPNGTPTQLFYSALINQTEQNGYRIGPISGYVDDQTEVRRAIMLPSGSEIVYPVRIQRNSKLLIATRTVSDSGKNGSCALRFQIQGSTFPGFKHTLFKRDFRLTEQDRWTDHVIDLDQFENQKTKLTFHTNAVPSDESCRMALQISNPRILVRQPESSSPFRHIVMATFDSLRADHLSLYGYERKTTSAIDAMARDGIQFQNVISQASWTLPSFGSVFTSLYPSFHRVANKNSVLQPEIFTLMKGLKRKGFYNIAITNNPYLNPQFGFFRDFDEYHYGLKDREEHDRVVLQTIERMKGQKVFLFIHFIDPHIPYSPSRNHEGKFHSSIVPDRKKIYMSALLAKRTCEILGPAEIQALVDCYDEEILSVDHHMELLINQLKRLGMYDQSLIIFGADHGEEFQAHGTFFHGQSLYNDVLKVPLLIKLPKAFPKTKSRIEQTVQMIDLMPTILDLVNVSAPSYISGSSLVPLWSGKTIKKPDVIVSENFVMRQISLISGKYKYISTGRKQNCLPGMSEELYDIEQDPQERNNLSEQLPAVLEMFRSKKLLFQEAGAGFVRQRDLQRDLNPKEMDPATKQQLEALGYLQ